MQVATNVIGVWCGQFHTVFLTRDKTLYAMGNNDYGQLGDGTTTTRYLPVAVGSFVETASCGTNHTLFVQNGADMWGMGWNVYGQLGDGTTTDRKKPVQSRKNVVVVAGSDNHSAYVDVDGALWTMGLAEVGVLGNGVNNFSVYASPIKLDGMDDTAMVAAGSSHTLVVTTEKMLMGFGSNSHGELGDNTTTNRSVPIGIPTTDDVIAIAGGNAFSAFITKDGTLWTMGDNEWGQLGDGSNTDRLYPVNIDGPDVDPKKAVIGAATGSSAFAGPAGLVPRGTPIEPALALSGGTSTLASATISIVRNFHPDQDGLAFRNDGASMGNIAASYSPATGVLTLTSAGATANLTQWQAALWSVIYTNSLQSPNTAARLIQFRVNNGISNSLSAYKTVTVTAFNEPPTDLTLSAGTIYQSGGTNAVVGTLSATDPDSTSFTYTLVAGTGSDHNSLFNLSGSTLRANNAASLALGRYSVRLRATDSGNASFEKAFVVIVAGSTAPPVPVLAFDGGWQHTLYIENDGKLWGVGYGGYGELGSSGVTAPAGMVFIASDVAAAAAGAMHTLFLKTDGTLWATGQDNTGQLGDGMNIPRNTPFQVATGVIAIDAGFRHSAFVRSDGALWTVGSNEYGPFGEPLRAQTNDPTIADNPFRFSTKFTDLETGLVYYGHRFYDPKNGRFINKDPIEESGGLNLYGFCGNDGVNKWDYLGMDPLPSDWATRTGYMFSGSPDPSWTFIDGTMGVYWDSVSQTRHTQQLSGDEAYSNDDGGPSVVVEDSNQHVDEINAKFEDMAEQGAAAWAARDADKQATTQATIAALNAGFQPGLDAVVAQTSEVDPKKWTGGIVTNRTQKKVRSTCPRNDVSTVPS